jgi:multicomponent Na+:H+ antiporter subunit E
MKQVLCILFTFVLWLLLVAPWPLADHWPDVLLGVVVSLLVATLLSHIYPDHPHKALDPRRIFWFLLYVPYFLFYCVRANLDVAYRVLHPDVPIQPGIVHVRTGLTSDMAKTFLANSITLTPGTLTVDIQGQDLYIHWIHVEGRGTEAHTAAIVTRFERLLRRIFE